MLPIPLFAYKWIAVGGVILLLGGAVYVQTKRLDSCKLEYAEFVAKVKVLGEAQEAATKLKDETNKLAKEKADEQNKRRRAADAATIRKLRESHPSPSIVPAAPAGASRPELACFQRTDYQRATGDLVEAIRGLADEGSAAAVDLNSAREWAQQLR